MILGIGTDIMDIRRMEAALLRFGEKMEYRLFTAAERNAASKRRGEGRQSRAAYYAKRVAAKEACAKALGTGLRGIGWQDIEVVSAANGAPQLVLHREAHIRLVALCPPGMEARAHLSLSDEHPYALAYVILSAEAANAF